MLIGSLHKKTFTFKPNEIKCNIGLNAIILKHVSKIKMHLFKSFFILPNFKKKLSMFSFTSFIEKNMVHW
jgi:hypothetical protein